MLRMRPNARLLLCGLTILLSACYAVLVARTPEVATAVAVGYVALLLTIFVAVNVWKKP